MKVLFVGTGLIGGSFSLAMKAKGLLSEAGGFSRNPANLDRSMGLGIIDKKFNSFNEGLDWADWIILSIPVDAIQQQLPGILDKIRKDQLVIDFGSTKSTICESVRNHLNRNRFLAAHPIAGTEHSGPEAAFATLFDQKMMIICEQEATEKQALEKFTRVCQELSMKLEFMEATAHDRHLAYISHLSHITSFALSKTVLDKEKDGEIILELAGSGFASTVRLAKSSPEMWAPIFMENKEKVLEALKNYQEKINGFKKLLDENDAEGLEQYLREGREIRRIL